MDFERFVKKKPKKDQINLNMSDEIIYFWENDGHFDMCFTCVTLAHATCACAIITYVNPIFLSLALKGKWPLNS